jgi:RNA polymerase sigma-70 factor (ECF subfamily)
MEDHSGHDWTARLKAGDKKALEEFYDRFSPMLLGVCLRYTGIREDAEDLMHESLIKILRGLDMFNPRFSGSFEMWMKRIAVNTSLNFLREKMKAHKLNGWAVQEAEETVADPDGSSSLPDRLEPETAVRLIGELPEGYRMVLNLYVFENYSHKEIARELNISENTSKSQLSKARALLRKKAAALSNQNQLVKKDERA